MEGKMYFLYLICVLLLFSSSQLIKADDKSDCYVENITDEEWKTQKVFPDVINDVENKKSIFKGKYDNITSVGECNKYFCINLNEITKQLEIITSDDFSSIDGNGEYERANEILEIPRTIELVCSTGKRSLTVKINVKDTNNHAPSFSQPSYEYVLPMPMSPKINITNFGAQIKVTDVDFSNKDITFSPDYKGLSTKTSFGEKGSYSYILDLEFAAVKKLTSPTTFSLTATDTGTPPKSSTVNITFKIDEDVSEPPSFTQPSYLYKYDEKTKSISPADADGQGAMLEDSRDKLHCTLKGDNWEFFKVEVKKKEVKVSVVTPFDETKIDQQLVQLTIECSVIDKDIGTSTAGVIISFPKSTVGFSTQKYTAQYEIKGDDHSVNMTDVITLTGSLEDGVIKVEDYLKDYLEVKTIKGGWTLNKIKNLEENMLKDTEINFIIKLYNKDIELDTAFILLVLPNGEEGVDFDQSFFTGDYKFDDDGKGTMEAITITLDNKNFDIENCGLDETDYSQYFKTSCDKSDSIKLLKSETNLPKDKQINGTVPLSMWLDINLGAIQRKLKTAIFLHFSYAADNKSDCYVENITDEEWKTQKVFPDVINDVENKKMIFQGNYDNITSVGECNKYFCINLNETTKQLEIITSDDFSSIDGNGEYERANEILEIPRTIELVCSTGKRSLTVKINVKDTNNHAPSFSQPSYEFVLPMPMSPKINITNFGAQIKVTDVDFSNKDITFSPDYKGLSTKTSFGEKGSYSYILDLEFAAVKKLTSPTTFSLTATDTGTPPKSSTVEITFKIDEDVSEPPSFTQPSYLYKYDEKTKSISPADADGQGAMLEYSRDKLQCTLKGDNSELFKVEVKEKEVKVSVVTPFDETKIDQQLVQLTIECFVKEDIGISTAGVIISFPKSTVGFSTKKYTAQYEIKGDDHSVNMTDVITLTGSLEDGVIKVEDYLNLKDYLEVKKKSEGVWTLNKIKNLEENMLKNTEINFIIKLYNKDIELDTAFILLVLPNGEEGVDFDQSFFTGDYKFDDDGRGTMEAITITLNNKNLDIDGCDLEKSEYSQYFEVNCGNVDELKLIKKSDIPSDLLRDGTVPLTMWMDITLGNIKRRIETAILLNLEKAGETSPTTLSTTTPSTTSTSTTQSSPAEESDCSHTGWIIAVIVLLLLLIVYVIVTVIYYVRRIRNRTETEIPLPSTRMPMNGPLSKKRSSDKFKDVSTRRPTGFIRYNPDQDRSSLDSENGDARNEVEENTNRNRFMNEPEENFRKISEGNSKRRSIGFAIPPPPPPET